MCPIDVIRTFDSRHRPGGVRPYLRVVPYLFYQKRKEKKNRIVQIPNNNNNG